MRVWKILPLCVVIAYGVASKATVVGRSSSTQGVMARYRLDPSRSTFTIRAFSGGLLWFKGHDHLIAARDFDGEATVTPGSIDPASLRLTVRANSLGETRDVFTEQQKQIINKELREIVLEPDKYPEISFQSTGVTGKIEGGVIKVKIAGNLTLHGVTRPIVIPAEVTVAGDEMRARGDFEIERSDFNIKATTAVHGMVRVRDKLKVMFDMVGRRV